MRGAASNPLAHSQLPDAEARGEFANLMERIDALEGDLSRLQHCFARGGRRRVTAAGSCGGTSQKPQDRGKSFQFLGRGCCQ